jgi:hypothetical protein
VRILPELLEGPNTEGNKMTENTDELRAAFLQLSRKYDWDFRNVPKKVRKDFRGEHNLTKVWESRNAIYMHMCASALSLRTLSPSDKLCG